MKIFAVRSSQFAILAFFLTLFASCSKNSNSIVTQSIEYHSKSEVSNQKILTIFKSSDDYFKRNAYSTLSDQEKVAFLKTYLDLNASRFENDDKKMDFFKRLNNFISIENLKNEEKFNLYAMEAYNLFTYEENKNIFYTINLPPSYSYSLTNSTESVIDDDLRKKCHCKSSAASLCNLSHDCEKDALNCAYQDTGCGFLWQSQCDGMCVV